MKTDPASFGAARVLVLDDEPDLRTLYELTLLREGHQVRTAESLADARHLLATERFDVVITDMRLPDGDGLQLVRELTAARRPERCIMITAYGSAENAVEALKSGAFDYLTKPVDLKQFRSVVNSALQAHVPATGPADLAPAGGAVAAAMQTPTTQPAAPGSQALARLVGESAVMRSVRKRIARVANSMAPVLVLGESGTGKELAAGAIHACSHRGDGPFVPVNCGAIPENLLEAEFFGARKGSYTGATQDRQGFFHAASGGTLFLDEIGDLPLAMQAKLLRAIQERRVRPVGATQEEPVNVRIVSATHKNLAAEVQTGRFRQDLFYRLNVIEITIPPLRDRREDIPAICQTLLARIGAESGMHPVDLSPDQLARIANEPLHGNVRELENLLHRAIALGENRDSDFGALTPLEPATTTEPLQAPPAADPHPAPRATSAAPVPLAAPAADLGSRLDEQERTLLTHALDHAGFDAIAAAAHLGINERQMRCRMARLGITAPASAKPGAHATT